MIELGKRIKTIRLNKNMTQKQLAEAIGVPQSTLSKYENGNLRVDTQTLTKMANKLNVSVDQLLGVKTLSYDLLDAVCENFMGLSGMGDNTFIAIEDNLNIPFDTLKSVMCGSAEFSRIEKETLLNFLEGIYSLKYVELKRRLDNELKTETNLERWFYYLIEDRFGDCLPTSYGISFPPLDKSYKLWDKLTFDDIEKLKEDIYNYIDLYIYKSKLDKKPKEGE